MLLILNFPLASSSYSMCICVSVSEYCDFFRILIINNYIITAQSTDLNLYLNEEHIPNKSSVLTDRYIFETMYDEYSLL